MRRQPVSETVGAFSLVLALLLASAVLGAAAPPARADDGQRLVIPLSDPARPVTLSVSVLMGSISVTGYDGKEVIVVARDEDGDQESDEDRDATVDGMKRIPNTSIGVTAEERNNQVEVGLDWTDREVTLEIQVPRKTSVRANAVNGGDVVVTGVEGEHEIQNVNGNIRVSDVAGSVVAGTTNGDLSVGFTRIAPDKNMSFSSFNGDVDVTFPASLKADLRINSGRGDVLTDFDVSTSPQSTVVDRSDDAGRYRVRLEREVRATVGGGGPEMQFKTFNGDIYIRKRK